jgi:hypothetical protein
MTFQRKKTLPDRTMNGTNGLFEGGSLREEEGNEEAGVGSTSLARLANISFLGVRLVFPLRVHGSMLAFNLQ